MASSPIRGIHQESKDLPPLSDLEPVQRHIYDALTTTTGQYEVLPHEFLKILRLSNT